MIAVLVVAVSLLVYLVVRVIDPGDPAGRSSGFPGASTTGVPAGMALTPYTGPGQITTPGTVIDGKDITVALKISANNVTIRRSRIHTGAWYVIAVDENTSGTLIEDVEIDGLGANGAKGIYGSPVTVRRANIHGVEDGVQLWADSSVEDSWIHDLAAPGSPHYDGVEIDGGSDITVRHNNIDVPGANSAVMIDNYYGPVDNVTVDGNRLIGGNYTVYSDGQFTGGPITGVRVTNNRLAGWNYGWVLVRNNVLAASNGNIHDTNGAALRLS